MKTQPLVGVCLNRIGKVRTYQRRKRLHILFDKYAKARQELGECGRTGFAFALELITTPSDDNIVTHPSAGGTKRQFIMTNGSPVIRVVERNPLHHEGNFPTPRYLYDWIAEKWGPSDLDVCADRQSAKAKRWFSKEQDASRQDWICHRAYMNHPYKLCRRFLRKAREELNLGHLEEVVCLTKVDTCTDWFNDYVVDGAITFLHRRFIYDNTRFPAPNPSMVIIFRRESLRNPDGSLNVKIETPPRSQGASIRDKLAAD